MSVTDDSGSGRARKGALRTIAAFEAFKGLVALAAGAGLLSLLHHDLHHIAAALIGHIGLAPGDHYPAILLHDIDLLRATSWRPLLLILCGYTIVRFVEAYGLWNERRWGEWLGALSGALYLPFELQHLFHHPSAATAAVIALNATVVGLLAWPLWRQRRRAHPQPGIGTSQRRR